MVMVSWICSPSLTGVSYTMTLPSRMAISLITCFCVSMDEASNFSS